MKHNDAALHGPLANRCRTRLLPPLAALVLAACGTGGGGGSPSGGSPSSGGSSEPPASVSGVLAWPASAGIVVDQFGYRPGAAKVAVLRQPVTGYDAGTLPAPGDRLALVNTATGAVVQSGTATAFNGGAVDAISGDRVGWFDFSAVTTPGDYVVADLAGQRRSHPFSIREGIYARVLRDALRVFYYQRAGTPKLAVHAGAAWADTASHLGPGQDRNARRFDRPNDGTLERDLSGGWYDAGDYNKYTNWHAGYITTLLRAWAESPQAFGDDLGIPESGNGVPDLIDEVKWGLDWLVKMQEADGSVLSVVGLAEASPPSAATGPTRYGPASTSATLSAAAAFARGARALRGFSGVSGGRFDAYAAELETRARRAWDWAMANPAVTFRNNDAASGSKGLAAGQQEVDDAGRAKLKFIAAVELFLATGRPAYRSHVDANAAGRIPSTLIEPWELETYDAALDYARSPDATPAVAAALRTAYRSGATPVPVLGAVTGNTHAYRAPMLPGDYVWGSNAVHARRGQLMANLVAHALDPAVDATALRGAEGYLHYLHGVNPLAMVYLTNMAGAGAEHSAPTMYHMWFADGTRWDTVTATLPGPAPGYLTGGPNKDYKVDTCCPSSCGPGNDAKCSAEPVSPPLGQPPAKSYKNFNTSWPLNSWEITEPSMGYQVAYIRLLARFAR